MRNVEFVLETPWIGCEAREEFEFDDDATDDEIEHELEFWTQDRMADFSTYWEEV